MLDLNALKKALAVVGNVGKGTLTFDMDGVPVRLRMLTPDEDIEASMYARGISSEIEDKQGSSLTYLENIKRAILSYAIERVGDLDMTDMQGFATGEMTDDGNPVWIAKNVAMRRIFDTWGRLATMLAFQKYNELVQRVDIESTNAVRFVPSDLDAEITRMEARLKDLKDERERAENSKKNPATEVAKAIVAADTLVKTHGEDTLRAATNDVLEPEPEVVVTPSEKPTPPTPKPTPPTPRPAASAAPRQRMDAPVAPPPPRPAPLPAPKPDEVHNSMGDSDDDIAAENARLMAARAAARQQIRTNEEAAQAEASIVRPARPPHRSAAEVANVVFDAGGGSVEAARPAGKIGEIDAFRLPTEPITARGRSPGPKEKVDLNHEPSGAANPRFRPAR